MTQEQEKSDCCGGCPMQMGTSADVMGKGCLRAEIKLLTASRREIMKIDEEHVAEIERLKAENAELRKSLDTWVAIHGPAVAEP